MLLSAEHISKNYGDKQLLLDTSLFLNENERIGIIGINGTGKSTLLKILSGAETPDSGSVTLKRNAQLTYLPQNPLMNDENTVMEQVFDGLPKQFEEVNEYEAKTILTRLEISDFDAKIGTLSGGQKKRIALACSLIRPSDILILDEPTNHLDSETVSWLENRLKSFNGGIIMVTHDRYFLERVANRIVELSHASLYGYEANYSKYLELKAEREDMALASERKRQSILRREYQWIMRGARARGTKSKERIERYNNLLEKSAPVGDEKIEMSTIKSRMGKKIIEIEHISKAFNGKKVIDDFSYNLKANDRIGIVGKNGNGKSTLLNIISQKIMPDSGEVSIGSTIKIGYFTQEGKEIDASKRVYDFISEIADEVKTDNGTFSASQMLERFLFDSSLQYQTVSRLSGGEKRRLYLLSILISAPNVLLLDEPTNDLDIETLTILEDYLQSFSGAVIAVSHDRYFLDKTAENIFEVTQGGKINQYNGNFADYLQKKQETEKNSEDNKSDKTQKSSQNRNSLKPKKLKLSFNEERELSTIDGDIEKLEEKIAECEKEIENSASNYERLLELTKNAEDLKLKLEEKTDRWVYLNELAEKISAQ